MSVLNSTSRAALTLAMTEARIRQLVAATSQTNMGFTTYWVMCGSGRVASGKYYGGAESRCVNGSEGHRSLRGGSWDILPDRGRSANRFGNLTDFRLSITGFRVF